MLGSLSSFLSLAVIVVGIIFCNMATSMAQDSQVPLNAVQHPAKLNSVQPNPTQPPSVKLSPVIRECERIGRKLGSVTIKACLKRQLQDTGARSVRGQALLMKEYPPLLQRRQPIGRVLLIGGTHGDEYAAVSIVFKWMQTLDQYHSGLFHWHVAPLLNPDGLLLNHPSKRMNAHGVDLNRNMPTPDWYKRTARYWQKTGHDPRRYPGSAPLSEPESRWLYEEIRSFQPDVIVSVHAPFGLLDFDGPPKGPGRLGYLNLKLIGVYPGSLGNSAGIQHQIPVITVELPFAGIMPSQAQISDVWTDLVHWLRYNIPKQATREAYRSFESISGKLLASSPLTETEAVMLDRVPAKTDRPRSVVSKPQSIVQVNSPVDN